MPELPEAETVARGLAMHIAGRTVESVHLARSDIVHGTPVPLCAALRGRTIQRIYRRAKQIHFAFDGDRLLVIHLGMSGRLIVADRDAASPSHTHLRITFKEF